MHFCLILSISIFIFQEVYCESEYSHETDPPPTPDATIELIRNEFDKEFRKRTVLLEDHLTEKIGRLAGQLDQQAAM